MSLTTRCKVSCAAVLWFSTTCFGQADDVRTYATWCYSKLGVTPDQVANEFWNTGRPCYYGVPLTTTHAGTRVEDIPPGDPRLVPGMKNFLNKCDAPAWLPSGGTNRQCYSTSYISTLNVTEKVKGALLCRHKTRDPARDASGYLKDDDYNDIAFILHNNETGQTCWFQTKNGSSAYVDGRKVPAPHTAEGGAFWLPPSQTSGMQCARCHDNGPWMNSQWLYSQWQGTLGVLKDEEGKKYETLEYTPAIFGPSGRWKKTDDFVTVGSEGLLGTRLPECTSCHNLSARIEWRQANGTIRYNGTYSSWFDYATGRKAIPQAIGTDYLYTHWMPLGRRPANAGDYVTKYSAHLDALKNCMAKAKGSRAAPCADHKVSLGNPSPAPPGTGALVSATVVQTGQSYTAMAAALDTVQAPIPQVIAAGQTIRLGWQADATYDGCTIKATMPAGVLVPATGAPGPIGSGMNWQLPEDPPVIGPVTEPGIYDFSIYCRDTHRASVQFQVGTTGPRSVVKLVTWVNENIEAEAIHSHSLVEPTTTTSVREADSVELTWAAHNVVPNSCTIRGPGAGDVALTEPVSSKTFTFSGSTDQVFTFQCTGANDNVTRTVSTTLRPADIPATDLAINAAASPNPVGAGANLSYTLTIANNGPGAATGVTVTDNLPSTTTFVSCTATGGGVCGGTGNNRTISFSSLASGASATISLIARVNSSVLGGTVISNATSVSSSTPDPGTANNSATVEATVSTTISGLPVAPSNLAATALLSTRTKLTWTDNSTNESLFHIEHSRDGATFKQIAAVGAGVASFIFTLPDMTSGTTHYYRVRASNATGYSPYSNRVALTMPHTPAAPSNLTAIALLPTRTKLAWTDNSDNESLFHIEHSRDGTTFKQIAAVGAGIASFIFTLPDMTGGTTHYYRVRASNATGYSSYSNRATLTMPR